MTRQTWKAHLALILASLLMASYNVIAKVALTRGINQLVFCVYRDVIALAVLSPVAYFKERGLRPPLSLKIILSFFILGFTGVFLNQLLFLVGLNLTSPTTASAIQPSIPVFTFIFALLMGIEKIIWKQRSDKAKVGGALLCISGAISMVFYKGPAIWSHGLENMHGVMNWKYSRGSLSWMAEHPSLNMSISTWSIGTLLVITTCAAVGFYTCFQALVLEKYPAAVSVTLFSYLSGSGLIVLTAVFAANSPSDWILNSEEILTVFYAGLFVSALTFSLLSMSNKMVGPAIVALYTPIVPVFTSLLSYFVLGSSIYWGSVLGGILIVSGLYIVSWGQKQTWQLLDHGNQPILHHFNVAEDQSIGTCTIPLLQGLDNDQE